MLVGLAALACAMPLAAQERGTMEFGAFGSAASFDGNLSLKTAMGGGGRIAMYLDPRWSVEFEKAEMKASRPNNLANVNVGILASRLVFNPLTYGKLSFLLGGGAGISTETNFLHSYGVDGLVGAKLALTDNTSLRVDGVMDWLANESWKRYKSVRVGINVFRRPVQRMKVVTVMSPAPAPIVLAHEDSVSATETRRLRDRDAAFTVLRDSLRNAPVVTPAAPAAPADTRANSDRRIKVRKDPVAKP
jgi:hypothetical protein